MKQILHFFSARKLLLLLFLLTMVGNVWGDSYEIVFATGTGDGSSASTSTAASAILSSGSSYVTGNLATATKTYYNGSSGLKLGTSSASGVAKINISTLGQKTPTSIDVYACYYNSSKTPTLKVNGSATQTISTGSSTKYTYSITSAITYIELTSSRYCWVQKVVVNYASTKTLSSIAVSGTPTKTIYEAGEALDPTGLVVTGTYSDASTAPITEGVEWTLDPETLSAGATTCDVMANVGQITSEVYTVTGLTVNAVATKYNVNLTQPEKATIAATPTSAAEGATVTLSYSNVADHYHFVNWYILDGDANEVTVNENNGVYTFTMPASAVEVEATFEEDAKHYVYFNVNGSDEDLDEVYEGDDITFPAENPADINGRKFVGWVATEIEGMTDDAPLFVTSAKMGNKDVTYYAVFATEQIKVGNGDTQVASMSVADYASANGWVNDVKYTSMIILSDILTATAASNGNNGKYYTTDNTWRIYQADKGTFTITAADGYVLESVTITYKIKNTGVMTYGGNQIESGTKVNVTGSSVTFCVANTSTATNGQFQITKIEVEYHRTLSTTYSNYCTTLPKVTFDDHRLTFVAQNNEGYWATFSNDKVVLFDSAVEAYMVNVDGDKLVMTPISKTAVVIKGAENEPDVDVNGAFIPANTGVLLNLKGTETEVNYWTVEGVEVSALENNLLKPASVAMEGDYKFYKLAYSGGKNLGFYWGAAEGVAFTVKAGTAYLAVPSSNSAKGFPLAFDDVTGINTNTFVPINGQNKVYNIFGQEVPANTKGIVIINGKKVYKK